MTAMRTILGTVALVALGCTALGLEADDVARLAKAGTGDEVIVAQIKATGARFALTTDEIVRLKKEGVSDAVLKVMIETGAAPKPPVRKPEPPAEDATGPAEEPAEPKTAAEPPREELGTLVIENLDTRDYSLQIDAQRGNIYCWKGVSSEGRDLLPARSSVVYRVSPGSYSLRWVGEKQGFSLKVSGEKESRATLTRTSTDDFEALDVSLFEEGERRGGGRLVRLAERSASRSEDAPAEGAPAIVEKHYYHAPQPEVQVVQPRTVYYYEPAYRTVRYCRDDAWWLPGLSYNWSRGRSRYAVGWGPGGGLGFTYHRRLGRGGYTISLGW